MIMRVLLYFFLVVLLIQCETPTDEVEETNSIESYCITGDCWVKLYTEENPDENGYHHIGGTRMGDNISNSVVDKNCKVHKIQNLFVAGSSVFPTAGHAYPTLTITQLSLRLGDYIYKLMA